MLKIIEIKAKPNYSLWVKYEDGTEGVVDLSHLVGNGVFAVWSDPTIFEKVIIDNTTGSAHWNENIEICADALYLMITGKSPQVIQSKYNKLHAAY